VEITPTDWSVIRRVFTRGFASSFHFAVASVGADGSPHLTPIGSVMLGTTGQGFYFEEYAVWRERLTAEVKYGQRSSAGGG
jgi:hypothetical protein